MVYSALAQEESSSRNGDAMREFRISIDLLATNQWCASCDEILAALECAIDEFMSKIAETACVDEIFTRIIIKKFVCGHRRYGKEFT